MIRISAALLLAFTLAAAGSEKPFRLDPSKAMTQYVPSSWRDTSGLPVDSVSALAQTRDGYLWVGTEHGLVRFDGVRFTLFTMQNTPALRSNEIQSLFVSSDGTLWIGTNGGGALRFDGTQFDRIPIRLRLIVGFAESDDGAIWIGAPGGVARVHDGKTALFGKAQGYPGGRLTSLAADHDGVYLGMPDGVIRLDAHSSRVWTARDGLSRGAVTALRWTQNGLLAGTENGAVDRLAGVRFEKVFHTPSPHAVTSIVEGERGSLWMSTNGGGILRYADGQLAGLSERDGLTSNSVNQLHEDEDGNLWAGTVGGGLVCLKEGRVTTIVPPRPLAGEWILPLAQASDGSVWFTTNGGGAYRLEGKTLQHFTNADGLASDEVLSLAADRDGAMWVATDHVLHRLTSRGIVETIGKEQGLDCRRIIAMTRTRDGSLLVSTNAALFRVEHGVARKLTEKDGAPSEPALGISEAPDGSLWFALSHAVEHLAQGKLMRFGREDGLVVRRLSSIAVDEKDGSLWVATMGDGLARIRDGRVRTFRAADGLLTDSVYGVVQDRDGNLWIPTSLGLFTMKRSAIDEYERGAIERIPIAVFRKSEGLKSSDFTGAMDRPGFRAFDGRLWFPSTRGLVVADPATLRALTAPPRVLIEGLSANGEAFSGTRIDVPGRRQIQIAYSSPTFQSPEETTFRYRLEGFDETWNDVGRRRTAFYTNVPPGRYRFVVQAMTAEGRMNEAMLPIEVVPHFHERWLFRFACGLLVLLVALVLHRRRVDALRRHQVELRKSEEHFRSLIENASDMIVVVGEHGRIEYASPSVERSLGFTANELPETLGALLCESEAGEAFLSEVRERERAASMLAFRDASGARRDVDVVGATYGDDERIVLNCRDNTERRRLESQLEQANRLAGLGRLAATVSHEFNNVLMGIQPFIDLIRRKSTDSTTLRATGQMTLSVARGKRISEEILRFTRPVDPTVRPIPVRSWLLDLDTELRSLVGSDVRLALVAPQGLTISGDIAQLNQILTNMAINARDAGATIVRIDAEPAGGDGVYPFGVIREPESFAHLRFTDNGSGISDSVLPKIFEPLFTTKLTKGTGLGLAVAHQVVMRHGGELFVESRVGAGTTFHIFLPIALSEAGELLSGDETFVCPDTPERRILLVEDDAIVADGMMSLLEERGFHVELARTGADALNLLPRCAPDVVVLDIGLPDIDGTEIYARIAKKWPELPVIFSTGHGDVSSLQSEGASQPQCLLKPYTVDALIQAIVAVREEDRHVA